MNIKNNKNCKITINDEGIAVSEKEKTADELFKELGYEIWTNDKGTVFYKGENKNIIFDKYAKEICLSDKTELGVDITMKELQAINKKCQELGWI